MTESVRPYSNREMEESALVKEALQFSVPLETTEELKARKARLLPSIKNRIANVPASREKRRREAGLGKLLAAAALVFILGGSWASVDLWLRQEPSQKHADEGSSHDLRSVEVQLVHAGSDEEQRLDRRRPGDTLSLGEQQVAHLHFPDGTAMKLAGDSAIEFVTVEPRVQEVRLNSGKVTVDVPHESQPKRKVAVVTPHGRAVVKGTKFSVEVRGSGDAAYSKVMVERGIVEVQHRRGKTTLYSGDSWMSASGASSTPPPDDGSLEFAPPNNPRGSVVEGNPLPRPRKSAEKPESDLAEQNRMIERALAAEKSGDLVGARKILSLFVARHPDSPLLESVQVALRRVRAAEKETTESQK